LLLILNVAAIEATNKEAEMNSPTAFVEVLQSEGRSAKIRSESDIYGWLIGNWKIRALDYKEDGSKIETRLSFPK